MHSSSAAEALNTASVGVPATSGPTSSSQGVRPNISSFASEEEEEYLMELNVSGSTSRRKKGIPSRKGARNRRRHLSKREQVAISKSMNGEDNNDDPAETFKKNSSDESDDQSKESMYGSEESFYGSEEDDLVQPLAFDRPDGRDIGTFPSRSIGQPKRSSWCPAKSRIAPSLLARPQRNKPLPPSLQPRRESLLGRRSLLGSMERDILAVQKLDLDFDVDDDEEGDAVAPPPRRRDSRRASSLGKRPGRRSSLPVQALQKPTRAAGSQRDIILDNQESFSSMLHSWREKSCDSNSSESSLELDRNDLLLLDSDDDDDDEEDSDSDA